MYQDSQCGDTLKPVGDSTQYGLHELVATEQAVIDVELDRIVAGVAVVLLRKQTKRKWIFVVEADG